VLIAARRVDVLALNRIIGLGLQIPTTDRTITSVIEAFVESGSPRFFIPVAPLAGAAETTRRLEQRGARHYNNWMRLSCSLDRVPAPGGALRVEVIDSRGGAAFGSIVADAFGYPAAIAGLPIRTIGRTGWRHYLAYDAEQPVAAAAMYVAGDAAWFGFAATAASHRGRGAQTALILRRLGDARDAGCRWVSVETAEDTVEKNAPSFRNLRRLGFEVAYTRPNYLWTRPEAGA
jgi:ribosomal protein S18 acetylase RimI-like enzyme